MWDLLGENGFLHLIEGEMARVLTAPGGAISVYFKYKNRIFDH